MRPAVPGPFHLSSTPTCSPLIDAGVAVGIPCGWPAHRSSWLPSDTIVPVIGDLPLQAPHQDQTGAPASASWMSRRSGLTPANRYRGPGNRPRSSAPTGCRIRPGGRALDPDQVRLSANPRPASVRSRERKLGCALCWSLSPIPTFATLAEAHRLLTGIAPANAGIFGGRPPPQPVRRQSGRDLAQERVRRCFPTCTSATPPARRRHPKNCGPRHAATASTRAKANCGCPPSSPPSRRERRSRSRPRQSGTPPPRRSTGPDWPALPAATCWHPSQVEQELGSSSGGDGSIRRRCHAVIARTYPAGGSGASIVRQGRTRACRL